MLCTGDTCVSRNKILMGLLGRQLGEENREINNLHIKGEGANLKVCPCAQIFFAMLLHFLKKSACIPTVSPPVSQ